MHAGGLVFIVLVALMVLAPVAIFIAWIVNRRGAEAGATPAAGGSSTRSLAVIGVSSGFLLVLVVGGLFLVGLGSDAATPDMDGMAMGEPAPRGGSSPNAALVLPQTLGPLDRTHQVSGAEAMDQVQQLHRSSFPMIAAGIAHYDGPSGSAMLWIAVTGSADASSEMTHQMARRITEGGSPFTDPEPSDVAPGVWTTTGMDQQHYFWSRGSEVWWLAADPAVADRVIDAAMSA